MLLFQVYFFILVLGWFCFESGKSECVDFVLFFFLLFFPLHGLEMLKPVRFFQDFEVIRLGLKFGP